MNGENVQKALYDKMTGDTTLMSLVTGIYADVAQPDEPESDSAFPYITYGVVNAEAWDTKTDDGGDSVWQLDVWSRSGNFLEVHSIMDRLHTVLHKQTMTITGADLVDMRIETTGTDRDPDGVTKRGLVQVRVVYDNF